MIQNILRKHPRLQLGRADQIERRRQRGRSESYEISNLGEHPIWSRFSVQGPSGKTYEVAIRSLDDGIFHCQCPDFATNGLGTCKHVESVLHHLGDQAAEELKAAEDEGHHGAMVYLEAGKNPPQVRFRADDSTSAEGRKLAQATFGKRGILTAKHLYEDFDDFAAQAPDHAIEITPEALHHVTESRRREELTKDAAEAARDFAAFREGVVAKRDQGVDPPDDDDTLPQGLTEFVERFETLADWELDGAEHLLSQGRALLADDPELDKVRQTLAATEFLRLTGRATRILLTCPGPRRQLWMNAVVRYCNLMPRIVGGATFEELARADADSPYAVTSYNRLYRHMDKLGDTEWDTLVLDEVQRIKSWPAPTGQAIKSFNTRRAFALTSARLEERPQAFFYTVQLLDPYLFGPAWQFLDDHVLRDGRGAAIGSKDMAKGLQRCQDRWLRRRSEDVTLPDEARVMDLYVDVTHFQHRQLDPLLRTLLAMVRVQQLWSVTERKEVVSLLAKLRTICTLPELIKPERPGSPKLDELCHLVEDLCQDSLLSVTVCCRTDAVAERVAKRLTNTGIPITYVASDPPEADRVDAVAALAKGERPCVLVISDVAAQGVDLTPVASIIFHAELPWSPEALSIRRQRCGVDSAGGCGLEYNLLCASTPEAAAAEALQQRPDHLAKLVTDPDDELETLVNAEEWQLRELIGLVVDERMVLRPKKALLAGKPIAAPHRAFTLRGLKAKERSKRSQVPQQRYLLGEKGESQNQVQRRPPARPERDRPAPSSRGPARTARPSAAGDVLVLGLETREDRATANQPGKVHTLGLAIAVTYSFKTGSFTAWRSEYINDLVRTLLAAKLVVGYNPFGFEYKILAPYTGRNLTRIPTVDLMLEITKGLGRKPLFDLIVGPTLDREWVEGRSQASDYFKQGRVREVAGLCTEGVKIVRDLFVHGLQQGEVSYLPDPDEPIQPLKLDLRSRVSPELLKVLRVK
jgi:SNF2-related domain/Helicase conserved C-terminal domain